MTHDEFDDWIDQELAPRLPSVTSWIEARPLVYREWCKELTYIESADATTGLDVVCDLPLSPWDTIARRIRTVVREKKLQAREDAVHSERAREDGERRDHYRNATRTTWNMGDAVRRIMAGEKPDDVLPSSVEFDDDQPRYRCCYCRDGGMLNVWAKNGDCRSMVCGCSAGDRCGEKIRKIRFDFRCMRLVRNRRDRKERDEAIEWYKQNGVKSRSNYSPGLAAYGRDE